MINFFKKKKAERNGFLLVELLVAIALFSIIVVIAVGGFVNVLKTQRQVVSLMGAESNLDIVLEEIAREIRTGSHFSNCSQDEPETCSELTFVDAEGEIIDYTVQNGVLERSVDGATAEAMTSNNVAVKYFNAVIFGNDPTDHWNPRITIVLGITPGDPSLSGNTLNLQTTISARQIDCSSGNPSSC